MKILVACEYSGVVRNAFRKAGHDAWSCDIIPCDDGSEFHIHGDVLNVLEYGWDMMIAHPPCTYLANSGVCHLHKNPDRWDMMRSGAEFFNALLNAEIDMICVENPIQHKYAREIIDKPYTQIIQPWMFGHTEQKATCLWLKNLPKLEPTNNVRQSMMKLPDRERQRLHYLPPSADRWKERSKTFTGIADAMAAQWG